MQGHVETLRWVVRGAAERQSKRWAAATGKYLSRRHLWAVGRWRLMQGMSGRLCLCQKRQRLGLPVAALFCLQQRPWLTHHSCVRSLFLRPCQSRCRRRVLQAVRMQAQLQIGCQSQRQEGVCRRLCRGCQMLRLAERVALLLRGFPGLLGCQNCCQKQECFALKEAAGSTSLACLPIQMPRPGSMVAAALNSLSAGDRLQHCCGPMWVETMAAYCF